MSPRHFSKMMFSPYFQSDHYQNESKEAELERKIENKVKAFVGFFNLAKLLKKK